MSISTSFYIGTKPKKKNSSMYLTMAEKKTFIKGKKLTALVLLEYYLSVIARDNYVIDDKKTADATGLSLRSVQINRLYLQRNNLFWVNKTTGNGMTHYLYCARKEGVYCKKYFGTLFGCNTVSEVYRKYSRKEFNDILVKNNLSKMEIDDITDFLDRHHYKLSRKSKARSEWSSL